MSNAILSMIEEDVDGSTCDCDDGSECMCDSECY